MKNRRDSTLLAEIRKFGLFDTNACYQCGSCTLICELTNSAASFPRKIIRYVLLGLKDLLHSCLEPWICHDCGDCSSICPRESEPRESMATLRRYLSAQYDWTGISSKLSRSKIWYIGSLSVVGALVLLLVVLYHSYVVNLPLSYFISTSMGLEHMYGTIKYFTLGVIFIPLFFLISFAFRMFWLTIYRGSHVKIPLHLYITEVKTYVLHSVTHKKLSECPEKIRWPIHWLLAFGCTIILVFLIFFLRWFQTDNIYPVYYPQRWMGYLATIFIVFGSMNILFGRIKKREEIYKSSKFEDFIFPIFLLLTAVSGIVVHISRYLGFEIISHYLYVLHLVIVIPVLVVEIPFGKWSHMLYRPLAIYFQAVKEKAMQQQSHEEAIFEQTA